MRDLSPLQQLQNPVRKAAFSAIRSIISARNYNQDSYFHDNIPYNEVTNTNENELKYLINDRTISIRKKEKRRRFNLEIRDVN